MGVVSVSLDEENMEALDRIQSEYSLKGRSEAVRMAILAAMDEIRENEAMEGAVEGVLIIVRSNHADPWMIQIQAKYEMFIKTQMHSHLQNHKCLEVMVVSCDAKDLSVLMSEIKAQGKADYVKFVRS